MIHGGENKTSCPVPLQDNREAERGRREAASEPGRYSHLRQASGLSDLSFLTGMVVLSWGGAPEVKDRPLYSKWVRAPLEAREKHRLTEGLQGLGVMGAAGSVYTTGWPGTGWARPFPGDLLGL